MTQPNALVVDLDGTLIRWDLLFESRGELDEDPVLFATIDDRSSLFVNNPG